MASTKLPCLAIPQGRVYQAQILNGGSLQTTDQKEIPSQCYSYFLDSSRLHFVLSAEDKYIETLLGQLSIEIKIISAGQLCVNSASKIYYFNNQSSYAAHLASNSNFVSYLSSRGMALAQLGLEDSLVFGEGVESEDRSDYIESQPETLIFAKNLSENNAEVLKEFKSSLPIFNWESRAPQQVGEKGTVSAEESATLGKGGFGKVSKVVLKENGSPLTVAVKYEISHETGESSSFSSKESSAASEEANSEKSEKSSSSARSELSVNGASSLRQEADVLQIVSANNPNVVKFYAFMTNADTGSEYLVMEYLPTGSLENEAFNLNHYKEAAKGLLGVHADGYIHGDVKSANMGLGTDGSLRITDFGLAAKNQPGHKPRGGSPGYAAPEVKNTTGIYLKKNSEGLWAYTSRKGVLYDPTRADVYALAYDMYKKTYGLADYARTGKFTFDGRNIDGVLKKGLEQDPAKRPSMTEFSNKLNSTQD